MKNESDKDNEITLHLILDCDKIFVGEMIQKMAKRKKKKKKIPSSRLRAKEPRKATTAAAAERMLTPLLRIGFASSRICDLT